MTQTIELGSDRKVDVHSDKYQAAVRQMVADIALAEKFGFTSTSPEDSPDVTEHNAPVDLSMPIIDSNEARNA